MASSGAADDNPRTFTGREDDTTGLMYFRARYYDPNFGRFVSEDPVGYYGGMNFYAYAGNSPVNYYDPSGLAPVPAPPGQPPIPVPWRWRR
jgi:RHS repeat-associated protein